MSDSFNFSSPITTDGTVFEWSNVLNWSTGTVADGSTISAVLGGYTSPADTIVVDGTYTLLTIASWESSAYVSIDGGGVTVMQPDYSLDGNYYGGSMGVGDAYLDFATDYEIFAGLTVAADGTVGISTDNTAATPGTLTIDGYADSDLAGTIDGSGTLVVTSGNVTIEGGAALEIPALTLETHATLQLAGDVTYAGTFASTYAMVLNGNTLTLTGTVAAASINVIGTVGDTGSVVIDAPGGFVTGATPGGFNPSYTAVDGNDVLEIATAGTEVGYLYLGNSGTDSAQLLIDANASYTIDGGQFIGGYEGNDQSSVDDDGSLVVAAGTAQAEIQSVLMGTGELGLSSGVLRLDGSVAAGLSLALDAATTLELVAPGAVGADFTGFAPGATLELMGIDATIEAQTFDAGTGLDNVTLSDGTTTLTYGMEARSYLAADSGGATFITVACFSAGTRIATVGGEMPVEMLRPGHHVATTEGLLPVVWIGRRHIDLRRHPDPALAAPLRVRAGAFAPGVPARDLWLSPDHAVLVDGSLIPIRCLANGATIARDDVDGVTYFHVELARHAILFAERLPAESYLDTGNRADFEGGAALTLHPDFRARTWRDDACAPQLLDGPLVAAARARLWRRAASLGFTFTDDPAFTVLAGGQVLPLSGNGYDLPPGARTLCLVSRSAVPAELDASLGDRRRLGVPIVGAWFDDEKVDDRAWLGGAHAAEAGLLWTTGEAWLRVPEGARHLRLRLGDILRYWRPPDWGQKRGAVAPGVGLEPTTERLTAASSTS